MFVVSGLQSCLSVVFSCIVSVLSCDAIALDGSLCSATGIQVKEFLLHSDERDAASARYFSFIPILPKALL